LWLDTSVAKASFSISSAIITRGLTGTSYLLCTGTTSLAPRQFSYRSGGFVVRLKLPIRSGSRQSRRDFIKAHPFGIFPSSAVMDFLQGKSRLPGFNLFPSVSAHHPTNLIVTAEIEPTLRDRLRIFPLTACSGNLLLGSA